jgi:2-oxoglutarate dehydrogenase E2 component (dihydrolipoamide succinyltransferase)
MPQMGESITEGTISKWLKAVGEKIERDEPILEISTDKVDAEVPAPAAGVLLEIRHTEGETVEVGTAVAIIGEEGESSANGNQQTTASAAAANGQQSAASSQSEEEATPMTAVAETQPEPSVQPQSSTATDGGGYGGSSQDAKATAAPSASASAPSESSAASSAAGAAEEVVMPQMGESITEGTISKWLKAVGDTIERDEPLLEISTDKVDAEVPSPAAGTLLEIRHQEGETVEVGTVLALVGSQSGAASAAAAAPAAQKQAVETTAQATGADVATTQQAKAATAAPTSATTEEQPLNVEETAGRSYDYDRPEAKQEALAGALVSNGGEQSIDELRRTKSSPLVRNIAKEHGIDLSRIPGSGMSGRVTKKDILSFIESGAALKPQDLLRKDAPVAPQISPATTPATTQPQAVQQPAQRTSYTAPPVAASVGDRVEPMSVMRKKIAEHMTFSKQTSAHVTSVYEIDMTNVARFRDKNKAEFQSRYGTKLTFMPFIFQATTQALRKFPVVNAQVAGEQIVYKGDINLGMAVALDWGLIVPVIKRADTLSLSGLATTANDLADRARTKKLMPDEVSGGTFTITNPGVFGGLFGTPIINQPQVAILCVGTIEKRPKVITTPEGDDVIAIRSMSYFALTYDHRIVDGADAEKFLSFMKNYLETTQFTL